MFDPTIYENLKIVIEGAVYDLDLSGDILVTQRSNRVELSTMSRSYSVQFKLQSGGHVLAEIRLGASTLDLAAEILEMSTVTPGCTMDIQFEMNVANVDDCETIQLDLEEIWGTLYPITQKLSFDYGQGITGYRNEIIIDFGRKFGEDVIGDIPRLLDHVMKTLLHLNEFEAQSSR